MKQKTLPSYGAAGIKWHALIFIVTMLALWLTIPSMTYYPDPSLPGAIVNAKQHTVNLLSVTLLWSVALIVHFALYRILRAAQRNTHRADIERRQGHSPSRLRLDIVDDDFTDDKNLIDEEANQKHLQAR